MLGVVVCPFACGLMFDWFQTLFNNSQQHAITSNNIQKGVQTDATCNIQQRWELLSKSVGSACTGLYNNLVIHKKSNKI